MTKTTCPHCGYTPPALPKKEGEKPHPDSLPLRGRPRLGGTVVRMCRSCKGALNGSR